MQLALLAHHICREQHVVRLQLSQPSDISAVGCPNNMGKHVNASEDSRDNILGRRRMLKASILEGPDEMSTVNRLKLPALLTPFGRLHQRNRVSRRKLD